MKHGIFCMCMVMAPLAGMLGGCESHLVPLRPVERMEVWVPDDAAATQAAVAGSGASTMAAATEPAATQVAATEGAAATQPGHMVVRVVDPNEISRYVYKATYDNVWQQAMALLTNTGFALDRQDYRDGVLTTKPLPSSQVLEFWKPQQVNFNDAMENTINNQRRTVRLTISKVPGKPDFYEIGLQVLVERKSNPTEVIGGPLFVEGSGFGRNAITLQSDYAQPHGPPATWVPIGHDPDLERKLIDALFQRI
jgi:hypothetical protein